MRDKVPHLLRPRLCLKPTRREQFMHKGHFSLSGPILRTMRTGRFWALETLRTYGTEHVDGLLYVVHIIENGR